MQQQAEGVDVVAPSLTPDSYTTPLICAVLTLVVAPSLTPDSYTSSATGSNAFDVVAPSLTPDSYTILTALLMAD